MEDTFRHRPYLSTSQVEELAGSLKLSNRQVTVRSLADYCKDLDFGYSLLRKLYHFQLKFIMMKKAVDFSLLEGRLRNLSKYTDSTISPGEFLA